MVIGGFAEGPRDATNHFCKGQLAGWLVSLSKCRAGFAMMGFTMHFF